MDYASQVLHGVLDSLSTIWHLLPAPICQPYDLVQLTCFPSSCLLGRFAYIVAALDVVRNELCVIRAQ